MYNFKNLTTIIIAVCFLAGCAGSESNVTENTEQTTSEAAETTDEAPSFETVLTTLSAGTNDIKVEFAGLTRRLLITTPTSYDNQKAIA